MSAGTGRSAGTPRLVGVMVAVVALLVAALPAAAQDTGGTITAEVTIAEAAEACLLLSVETLDLGVLDFDDTAGSDPYTVTSCSTGSQQLFAASTDAASDGDPPVVWELVDGDGPRAVDEFSLDADLATIGDAWLATEPTLLGTLDAQASADATHQLVMPPAGSSGAGQTLSFDITWTAVLDDTPPTWTPQDSGTSGVLRGVDFVDPQHGWAVGSNGTIIATSDGGRTWVPQGSGRTSALWDVGFADEHLGVAVGSRGFPPFTGVILRTVDGGGTWELRESGVVTDLTGVHVHDAQRAWAVGLGGVIVASNDGGLSWTPQTSGTTRALADVYFIDPLTGWAAGADTIVATVDGGATWTAQEPPIISIQNVWFVDSQRGWAANNGGDIIGTTDGGATWQLLAGGSGQGGGNGLQFLDEQRGWIGAGAGIFRTVDGGTTWERETPIIGDVVFEDLVMLSPTRGWAVGSQGTVYRYGP